MLNIVAPKLLTTWSTLTLVLPLLDFKRNLNTIQWIPSFQSVLITGILRDFPSVSSK